MFDAASRLAQGRPAVDVVQDYVWACHLLGYQDPDLTLHAAQVRDWYGSEDGIDLPALDADCEALRAAAAATEGALARQDAQLASMSVAWHGTGAQATRDFLRRHGQASAVVVTAVRTAAESLASLRDQLWHSIDGKVAATMATEGRGARPDWRAAAQTVTTGAGDRATASELVDQEVRPFVESDIRSEWLTAMRSAMAAVTNAYDAAAAELTSEAAIAFDVPGDLGPSWSPPPSDVASTAPAGVSSVGAGPVGAGPMGTAVPAGAPTTWSAPPSVQPMSAPQPLPSSAPPSPVAPPVEPAAMAPPSLGGGGMPDTGSGLSRFGGQLGDMLGGLLGTSQDELGDSPEIDEPAESADPDELDEDEPEADEDEPEADVDEEDPDAIEVTEADPAADVVEEPETEAQPADPQPPAPTEPPPVPPPPPIEPLTAPAPPTAGGTPCEIAADELPQVGE
jgi:uncharacterized protein YukE